MKTIDIIGEQMKVISDSIRKQFGKPTEKQFDNEIDKKCNEDCPYCFGGTYYVSNGPDDYAPEICPNQSAEYEEAMRPTRNYYFDKQNG